MRSIAVVLALGVLAAQAPPAGQPGPMGNLNQVMRGITSPASNAIFEVQRKAPADEAAWKAVEDSAIAIAESARLIVMPGRKRENGQPAPLQRPDWQKLSQAMAAAGQACYQAARSRKQEAVSDCTSDLADSCSNCHDVYLNPASGGPAGPAKKR